MRRWSVKRKMNGLETHTQYVYRTSVSLQTIGGLTRVLFEGFTQYSIDVQPSIVIHWNTVSMANPMLSKLVMPEFGPSHLSRHMLVVLLHTKEPPAFSVVLSVLQGVSDSPSFTSLSVLAARRTQRKRLLITMIQSEWNRFLYLDPLSYNKSYAVCPNKTRVQ